MLMVSVFIDLETFPWGLFENFLWAVLKSDKQVCLTCRIVEGRSEGCIWLFIIVHIN